MRKGLKVLLAVVVVALMTAAATLAANSRSDASSGDTLVFGSAAEPTSLDGAVVSDGESLRVIDQITEGLVGLKPRARRRSSRSWRSRGQASNGGRVWTFSLRTGVTLPRRDAFQRQRGLRELRPVVQLHRPVRLRRDLVLLLHGLQRLQEEGQRPHELPALPELPGGRQLDDGGDHAAAPQRLVPRRALAHGVPHPEPDGDGAVRREQGHALQGRRLHAGRPVRRAGRSGGRHRAVQARVVEDRRPARARPQRRATGAEGASCGA